MYKHPVRRVNYETDAWQKSSQYTTQESNEKSVSCNPEWKAYNKIHANFVCIHASMIISMLVWKIAHKNAVNNNVSKYARTAYTHMLQTV